MEVTFFCALLVSLRCKACFAFGLTSQSSSLGISSHRWRLFYATLLMHLHISRHMTYVCLCLQQCNQNLRCLLWIFLFVLKLIYQVSRISGNLHKSCVHVNSTKHLLSLGDFSKYHHSFGQLSSDMLQITIYY